MIVNIISVKMTLSIFVVCFLFPRISVFHVHIEYFAKRLSFSGYDVQYRYNVLKTACEMFNKMKLEFNINDKFFQNLIDNGWQEKVTG